MAADDSLSNDPAVSRMKPGPGAILDGQLAGRQLFCRLSALNGSGLVRPVPAGLKDK